MMNGWCIGWCWIISMVIILLCGTPEPTYERFHRHLTFVMWQCITYTYRHTSFPWSPNRLQVKHVMHLRTLRCDLLSTNSIQIQLLVVENPLSIIPNDNIRKPTDTDCQINGPNDRTTVNFDVMKYWSRSLHAYKHALSTCSMHAFMTT